MAFTHLTTCRNQGYSTEGPISWFSIDEYGRRQGYDEEQLEELHFYIPKMDSVYLDFKTKKLKQALAKQGQS